MEITNKNQYMVDLNYIVQILDKTWLSGFALKIIGGSAVTLTAFFIPIQPFIWMTIGLVVADFISALSLQNIQKIKLKK